MEWEAQLHDRSYWTRQHSGAEPLLVNLWRHPASQATGLHLGAVAGYDNDGLLQRFQLMVYPDPVTDWTYVDQSRDTEARDRLIAIARRLAKADFKAWGADQDEIKKTPCFRFSSNTQPLFVEWLTGLEEKIREMEHPIMAEHLSKYRKLIPALALDLPSHRSGGQEEATES